MNGDFHGIVHNNGNIKGDFSWSWMVIHHGNCGSDITWQHVTSRDITWHHVVTDTWNYPKGAEIFQAGEFFQKLPREIYHEWWPWMWYVLIVVSCDVMWCHVMSCDVMWCHVMSCDVMWCHVMSCDVMWCHVMSCDVMWCHVMSCDVVICWNGMECNVVQCMYDATTQEIEECVSRIEAFRSNLLLGLWLGLMGKLDWWIIGTTTHLSTRINQCIEQINKSVSEAHLLFSSAKASNSWITMCIVPQWQPRFEFLTPSIQQLNGADGEKCAVKSFKKHGLSEKRRGDLKNEARQLLVAMKILGAQSGFVWKLGTPWMLCGQFAKDKAWDLGV